MICTTHKILNTCSGFLRQLINLLQSYGILFRLIYGAQLRFLIGELPSTNQAHRPIKNDFTMGTAHWELNKGLILKLKLKYLLSCQLIQTSLWIIALPLLSKCYLFSLKVIVFSEKLQNNEHYFAYSDLHCHHVTPLHWRLCLSWQKNSVMLLDFFKKICLFYFKGNFRCIYTQK